MRLIKPCIEIIDELNREDILKKLEMAGRVCYKSEGRIKEDSAAAFIKSIVDRGHESVLEHVSFSVRFICDRGVSHEIVRHRIASYSQESTRYCNYSKDDFGSEITVIEPAFATTGQGWQLWRMACEDAESSYFKLLNFGMTPQEARAVLPNSLKTELIMTTNIREWRHFLRLRTSPAAHPDIRLLANMLLKELTEKLPELFGDL